MKIHYGVFNLKTKKFGHIEGPANKKTLRVHWPTKDGDEQIEDVSISASTRKVLEGSIEYKALTEPQTCLWLFREHPDEFFSTLINYRDQKIGLVLKESKILGKATTVTPKGKARSASVEDSFRDGVRDASGALLFPDFELFKEGWKKAVEIWAKDENPPVLIQLSGKKILSIKPGLEIEVELNGSIAEGSASSIEEIFDQDLASIQKWFESFTPTSSLEFLLKAAFTETPEFKNDSKFWESLVNEDVRLSQNILKKALGLAIGTASVDVAAAVKAFSLGKKFEIDSYYLDGDKNLEELAKCARVIAQVQNSPLAKIWLIEICRTLENSGYPFVLDHDFVLVEPRLQLKKSASEKLEILSDLAGWLNLQKSESMKNNSLIAVTLQSLLSGLTGEFSAARISIINYCITNKIDVAKEIFFIGLSINQLLNLDDLFRVVMSDPIADAVGKPVVTRELDGKIALEVLISVLNKGQPLLKKLREWGLVGQFNTKLADAVSVSPLFQEFIVPVDLQTQLKNSEDSLKVVKKELTNLQKSSASALELVGRLNRELDTLKAQLKASQTANDDLLASKVVSAMYTTSRAFASVLRTINRDVGLLPKGQIVSSIETRLLECGIKPRYSPGDVLAFGSGTMTSIDKDLDPGAQVEVLESAQELHFQDQILILTPALVRPIMGT